MYAYLLKEWIQFREKCMKYVLVLKLYRYWTRAMHQIVRKSEHVLQCKLLIPYFVLSCVCISSCVQIMLRRRCSFVSWNGTWYFSLVYMLWLSSCSIRIVSKKFLLERWSVIWVMILQYLLLQQLKTKVAIMIVLLPPMTFRPFLHLSIYPGGQRDGDGVNGFRKGDAIIAASRKFCGKQRKNEEANMFTKSFFIQVPRKALASISL